MGRATLKVEGGKLLSVDILFNQKIDQIEITGDFFIYPEAALQEIESALTGIRIDEAEEAIAGRIRQIIAGGKIEMIGVTPEAISTAMKEALRCTGD